MTIKNLCKSFGNNVIFNNFSVEIQPGKITYIMGKSGIGKTTLLRIISGLDKDYSGEVNFEGKLSYVFQEPRLFPSLNVLKNLTVVNQHSNIDPIELLEAVELTKCTHMMPSELSGGMKMRLSIARAIYFEPDIIIMDEPFASIDKEMKDRIAKKIFNILKNKTVIVVSHDLFDAKKYADNIINI